MSLSVARYAAVWQRWRKHVANQKGSAMYTIIDRRKVNRARVDETAQAAQGGSTARLSAASGFVGLYLVEDTEEG